MGLNLRHSSHTDVVDDFNQRFLFFSIFLGSWFAVRPRVLGVQPGSVVFIEVAAFLLIAAAVSRVPPITAVPKSLYTISAATLIFLALSDDTDLRVYEWPEYWGGFGIRRAALAMLGSIAIIGLCFVRRNLSERVSTRCRALARLAIRFVSWALIIWLIPSLFQPMGGWLNLGDGTQYVLEDLTGWATGNFPGITISGTYQHLLGAPLILLRLLNLGREDKILVIALYANLVVLSLPLAGTYIVKRLESRLPVATAFVLTTSTIVVSGDIKNTSLVQELSSLSRLLVPLIYCAFHVYLLSRYRLLSSRSLFVLGLLGGIVAWNNFEYGIPAIAASISAVATISHDSRHLFRTIKMFASGTATAIVLLTSISWMINPSFIGVRIGIYFGILSEGPINEQFRGQFPPPSPFNLVPLTLVLAVTCVATVVRRRSARSFTQSEQLHVVVTVFLASFTVFAMPHCLNLNCGRGGTTTQMFVPLLWLLGISAFTTINRLRTADAVNVHSVRGQENQRDFHKLPVLMISVLGVISVTQAPSAIDQLRRIQMPSTLPYKVDEWSFQRFDYVDISDVTSLADEFGGYRAVGYFGSYGNAVEIATGLENLTGVTGFGGYPNPNECTELKKTKKQLIVTMGGTDIQSECGIPFIIERRSDDGLLMIVRTSKD